MGTLFRARENSRSFLHRRDYKRRSSLQIDIICTNLTNLQERGEQVGRLRQIFGKAEAVFVWLYNAEEGSGVAMDWINTSKSLDTIEEMLAMPPARRHLFGRVL